MAPAQSSARPISPAEAVIIANARFAETYKRLDDYLELKAEADWLVASAADSTTLSWPERQPFDSLVSNAELLLALSRVELERRFMCDNSAGLGCRFALADACEAVARCCEAFTRDSSFRPMADIDPKVVIFNTDWTLLSHRLRDEHPLRNLNEGDEAS